MGLWAAVKAERLGMSTVLVEAGHAGQGASGGLLGALMPHMPDRWNAKKQMQFEALVTLEEEVARLEAETGLSCGYRRSGRLIPLPKPHLRTIALRHSAEAESNWRQGGHDFGWHVTGAPLQPGWPAAGFAEAGLVHDTLAARVFPRGLVGALRAALAQARHVNLAEGHEVAGIDPALARIAFRDGKTLGFGHCIVAAGHQAFPLIEAISAKLSKPLGQPVKGQAALLAAEIDPDWPLLFLDGLYVVPHDGGRVAIGSTSEDHFEAPSSTDALLDDLISRARVLAPALADAPVVERWAGLRPKAIDRDPMVGPHPDHPGVIALAGGFKVSFGLAHHLADAALRIVQGGDAGLPASFMLENHLAVASRSSS